MLSLWDSFFCVIYLEDFRADWIKGNKYINNDLSVIHSPHYYYWGCITYFFGSNLNFQKLDKQLSFLFIALLSFDCFCCKTNLHLILIFSWNTDDFEAVRILGRQHLRLFQGHTASDDDDRASLEDTMVSILMHPSHMFEVIIILCASSCSLLDHYLWVSQNVVRKYKWLNFSEFVCQSKQNGLKK